MKKIGLVLLALAVVSLAACGKGGGVGAGSGWKDTFSVDKASLASTGRNPYFILEPGYTLVLKGGEKTLTVSVLSETKTVDGVETRVVEEREVKEEQPQEISRNYFAIDKTTHDVYYFGEDVDEYKNGKIAGHEGAWLSGVNGAKFGLMIPGQPSVGAKYYQEQAPKVAMDRAEIVAIGEEFKAPAGAYQNCLRIKETSAVESGSGEKIYAPGVGLVKDDEFTLAKVGPEETEETGAAAEAKAAAVLKKLANIPMEKARASALAQVPGGKVTAEELELEDGLLIYTFDIQVSPTLLKEVHIDAKTGKFLSVDEEKVAPAKKTTGEEEEENEAKEKAETKEKAVVKEKAEAKEKAEVGEKAEAEEKAEVKEKAAPQKEPAFVGTVKIGEAKDLAKLAKISEAQAKAAALKLVEGQVTACKLEDEDGYLVYNVTVKFNNENYEVLVDAGSGKVVNIEIE